MANQIYRGNSEQKLYEIINNFVGGMNTVDVDEAVLPNEFRELVNVDLSKQGMLQNRKGFKHVELLSELFSENPLLENILTSNIIHVDIVRDDINLIETLKKYDTLTKFKEDYRFTRYQFMMLVIVTKDNPDRVELYEILVLNDGNDPDNTDWEHFVGYRTLPVVYGKPLPKTVTGVKPSYLGNLIYIPTSQLVENGNEIIELKKDFYDVPGEDSLHVSIISNNENYYETTPYDILDEGYNILAKTPLLNVKRQGSIESLQGITLVKYQYGGVYPLDAIPTDGSFSVIVMYTGAVPVENVKETLYYYDAFNNKIELVKDVDYKVSLNDNNLEDGIYIYDYQISKLDNLRLNIHIEYSVVDLSNTVPHAVFADFTEASNYFLFPITTKNTSLATVPFFLADVTPNETKLFERKSVYNYTQIATLKNSPNKPSALGEFEYYFTNIGGVFKVYKYFGTLVCKTTNTSPTPTQPQFMYFKWTDNVINPWVAIDAIEYNLGVFKLEFIGANQLEVLFKRDSYVVPSTFVYAANGSVLFYNTVTTIENLDKRIPANITTFIKVNGFDYVWSGTFTGVVAAPPTSDFENLSQSDYSESQYTVVYTFGTSEVLEPLQSIDLKNVKVTSMQDRLVLYKGNTIWWSVYGNPNYFPYKNYVNLPLIGSDEIVSINYFRGSHIVFTKERIFRISGAFPDITITLVNDSIGCIAETSVRAFNNTLVFLTYDGLYRLKQNYYMEGLENVEKIDKSISGYYPKDVHAESFTYNEQYFLLFKNHEPFDALRYYYNINLAYEQHPYSLDKYANKPDSLFKHNGMIYSIKNGYIYTFDDGYTDFLIPSTVHTDQQIAESTYKVKIKTVNLMLGYPTHDKKFKNLFVKTHTLSNIPLSITVYTNDLLVIDPHNYRTQLTMLGETEYIIDEVPNITTTASNSLLGQFILGLSKLGKLEMNVHKMPLATKGKYIQFEIEQETPAYFGIQDIGIVYKLNKIRAYQ